MVSKRIVTLSAVPLCLLAASGRAQDWSNTDAAAKLVKSAAVLRSAASAAPAMSPAAPASSRIKAIPTEDNTVFGRAYVLGAPVFVLNDTRDRVGARLDYSDGLGGDSPSTSDITFYFPQLSYDASTKNVYYGNVLIATLGTFVWNQYKNPDYKLVWEKTDASTDLGWNHANKFAYDVYLEKVR